MSDKELKSSSSEKVNEDIVSPGDSEAHHELQTGGHPHLKRTMKNRHIAMIRYVQLFFFAQSFLSCPTSIGGVIGTGLFLGTAGSLANGGPIGLLLGYSVVGTICYAV